MDEAPSRLRDWKFYAGGFGVGATLCAVFILFLFSHFASAADLDKAAAETARVAAEERETRDRQSASERAHAVENQRLEDLKAEVKEVKGDVKDTQATINDLYRFQTGREPPRKGK